MDVLAKLSLILALALISAAGISLSMDLPPEKRAAIASAGLEEPGETSLAVAQAVIGFDFSTPSWQFDLFGRHFDIPFPDGRDALILVPYWLLAVGVIKLLIHFRVPWPWVAAAVFLLFILGTLVLWGCWKGLNYSWMLGGAEKLGVQDELLAQRAAINEGLGKGLLWLGVYTACMFLLTVWSLWPKGGKR